MLRDINCDQCGTCHLYGGTVLTAQYADESRYDHG